MHSVFRSGLTTLFTWILQALARCEFERLQDLGFTLRRFPCRHDSFAVFTVYFVPDNSTYWPSRTSTIKGERIVGHSKQLKKAMHSLGEGV